MRQENLEGLIEKSRAGDRQAQEELVTAVQDRVYYHCRKMLKNPDDAKDAAQDILLSMLSGLGSLQKPAAFWGWLNRMTSNICRKRLSRSRRELPLWGEEPGAPLFPQEDLDDQIVPDRALDSEENRRMVVELVEALPEAQRLSVLFYYYDEMTVKEIAEAMETSENTVKSRLHYAREAIRKGVEKYAAEGFKLYGLTPVPFLRYFLQKEAASAAGALAGKAALAAFAGTAGKAAAAALPRVLGGALARRGLAAAAGLALAGAVAGGVLLSRPAPPAKTPPEGPSVISETHTPAAPEPVTETPPPEDLPAPSERTPETPPPVTPPVTPPATAPVTAPPLATPPAWMGEVPPSETARTPVPAPEGDGDPPQDTGDPKPPEDVPPPAGTPEGPKTPVWDDGDGDDGAPPPAAPDDTPDDAPPVIPIPPAVSVQYEPDPDFGDCLGRTEEGVYEFLCTARLPDMDSRRYPFEEGNFYTRIEIENPLVVRANGPYIYGVGEGTSDVRYYVSEREEGPYELKALVHARVLRQPVEAGEGYREAGVTGQEESGVLLLERTLFADGEDQPQPLVCKGLEMKLESGDAAVLAVRPETNRFYGAAPGTAEGRVYLRVNESFPWTLAARVRFTVEPVPRPRETCAPREDFGPGNGAEGVQEAAYLGADGQGLYAFSVTVREGETFRLQPLTEGAYEVNQGISDSGVVDFENLTENLFRAAGPGRADISYAVCPEGGEDFIPYAVVRVRVLPAHPPYFPNPEFGECLGRDEQDVWHFKASLPADGSSLPCALAKGSYYLRVVSGDPGVAAVRDGTLYSVAPGSAEVRYYVSETEDTGYFLQAVAQVEVTAPKPETPPEVPLIPPGAEVIGLDAGNFGYCQGCGYCDKFRYTWEFISKIPLPDTMEYRSSDPEIIFINEQGAFTTLSPGTAVLAAWDPGDPGVCYTMTFQVTDRFDWNVNMLVLDTYAGAESDAFVDAFAMNYAAKLLGIAWSCDETEILAVSSVKDMPLRCHLTGLAPGTATVTGTARFSLVTAAGKLTEITDRFTFQVEVRPA